MKGLIAIILIIMVLAAGFVNSVARAEGLEKQGEGIAETAPEIGEKIQGTFTYWIKPNQASFRLLLQNISEEDAIDITIQYCLASENHSYCFPPRTIADSRLRAKNPPGSFGGTYGIPLEKNINNTEQAETARLVNSDPSAWEVRVKIFSAQFLTSPIPAPSSLSPSGEPLKIPATGFAIPVRLMTNEAEVEPGIAEYIKGVYAYHIQPEDPNWIISMRMYNLLRVNIFSITTQICLILEDFSYCENPGSFTFPEENQIGNILLDANYSNNLRENIPTRGRFDWEIKVKILSVVLKETK